MNKNQRIAAKRNNTLATRRRANQFLDMHRGKKIRSIQEPSSQESLQCTNPMQSQS